MNYLVRRYDNAHEARVEFKSFIYAIPEDVGRNYGYFFIHNLEPSRRIPIILFYVIGEIEQIGYIHLWTRRRGIQQATSFPALTSTNPDANAISSL